MFKDLNSIQKYLYKSSKKKELNRTQMLFCPQEKKINIKLTIVHY